jgi:hypothetical protein
MPAAGKRPRRAPRGQQNEHGRAAEQAAVVPPWERGVAAGPLGQPVRGLAQPNAARDGRGELRPPRKRIGKRPAIRISEGDPSGKSGHGKYKNPAHISFPHLFFFLFIFLRKKKKQPHTNIWTETI